MQATNLQKLKPTPAYQRKPLISEGLPNHIHQTLTNAQHFFPQVPLDTWLNAPPDTPQIAIRVQSTAEPDTDHFFQQQYLQTQYDAIDAQVRKLTEHQRIQTEARGPGVFEVRYGYDRLSYLTVDQLKPRHIGLKSTSPWFKPYPIQELSQTPYALGLRLPTHTVSYFLFSPALQPKAQFLKHFKDDQTILDTLTQQQGSAIASIPIQKIP